MSAKINQADLILDLLSDGNSHSTNEIQEKVYGREHLGYANIHARITDLRERGINIPRAERDDNIKTLYWYHIEPPKEPEIPFYEMPEYFEWKKYYNDLGQGKLI
jgi:hypothetical protein